MGPVRAAWGRGKVAWGGVGLSRVEYHGTDAQASLGRVGPVRAAWGRGKVAWGGVGLSRVEYHGTDAQASIGRVGPVRAAWGRGKVVWGGVGLSRVEYHGTDAEASLTSGRRPSGVCEDMKSFKSEEVRNLDDIQEGCLTRYDSRVNRLFAQVIKGHDAVATAGANQRGVVLPKLTRINTTGIEQGKFVRMGHKPCCGFVQPGCYPPIRYCPLEFIFEIVSDAGEPVIRPSATVAGTNTSRRR